MCLIQPATVLALFDQEVLVEVDGRNRLVANLIVPDLRVGDVITYLPPADAGIDNLVTHRIHRVREAADGTTVYRTKGDANADADPWTFRLDSDEQPRMAFAVPAVGHVFIALADRSTRILAIGLPAALIALASLVQLVRALRPATRPTGPAVQVRST